MNNKNLAIILVVSIIIMVLMGGYFFWLKSPSGTKKVLKNLPTSQPLTTGTQSFKGFTKAQELVTSNRSLIAQFRVQLSYNGTLTQMDPGKSWTIEKNGKTATIEQQVDGEITYQKSTGKGSPIQAISAGDVKVGDTISINTFVDPSTGIVSITTITVLQ